MLTVIVKEQQLMPVTFTDNNAIALKDAMPPFMMGKYDGRKKDARPTNISLDAHKPVTILTGQNMSGKSKAAESVILNAILAQATGHAFVSGGVFSPRKEFHMLGSTSEEVTDTDGSRGFREMEKIGDLLSANREQSLIVLDEILTSTDGPGAFAIQAAAIEEMTRNGALMIMTIHSRATERAVRLKIPRNARYLQPVYDRGNPTYRWKPGVERANPHQLANNCGVNPGIIQRAQEIEKMLDMD